MRGKKLVVAGALSRSPVEEAETGMVSLVEEHVKIGEEALQGSNRQLQRMRDEAGKDSQLAALLECLRLDGRSRKKKFDRIFRNFGKVAICLQKLGA